MQVKEECAMKTMSKTLTAIAVAATLAVAAVATPQPAEARGGRIAAGIIGGLAVGAILGGIAANGPYGYYDPAYYAPPVPITARAAIGPTSVSGTVTAGARSASGFAARRPAKTI
jgi:hypothetical protein